MAAIAVHVLDQHFGTVGLEGDTVVAVIDNAVLNDDVRRTVRVPTICILRFVFAGRVASNVEVIEDDIRTVSQEVIPLRRVTKVEIRDRSAMQANCAEQDRAQDVDVLSIEVVPYLTIAVQHAAAVDVDVFTTNLEKRRGVLVNLVESVVLPVVRVVGKLNVALDVCQLISRSITKSIAIATNPDRYASSTSGSMPGQSRMWCPVGKRHGRRRCTCQLRRGCTQSHRFSCHRDSRRSSACLGKEA